MASQQTSFPQLLKAIKTGRLPNVLLLHGEEGYYIDVLMAAAEAAVPDDVRDFNLFTVYGAEAEPRSLIATLSRVPFMADRVVVLFKEAQSMKSNEFDKLDSYLRNPSKTTSMVIAIRGAKARAGVVNAIKAGGGVIFESSPVRERDLPNHIRDIVATRGLSIAEDGISALIDHIGADLPMIAAAADKIASTMPAGARMTRELIQDQIGISREFNNFELIAALASRDALKAMRIVEYFRSNPRQNPTALTLATLFNYFSGLFAACFEKDRSPSNLMKVLELRWQGQLKDYETGLRNYNGMQVAQIITSLRKFDANSKGVGSRQNEYDLLHDLVFAILTANGHIEIL